MKIKTAVWLVLVLSTALVLVAQQKTAKPIIQRSSKIARALSAAPAEVARSAKVGSIGPSADRNFTASTRTWCGDTWRKPVGQGSIFET